MRSIDINEIISLLISTNLIIIYFTITKHHLSDGILSYLFHSIDSKVNKPTEKILSSKQILLLTQHVQKVINKKEMIYLFC